MIERWVINLWWCWAVTIELLVFWPILNAPNTATWVCFVIVQVTVATGRWAIQESQRWT